MFQMEAKLAILGAYMTIFFWIIIGVFIWILWTPFRQAEKYAKRGYHSVGLTSLPDNVIATCILLVTQGFWCLLTLGEIITLVITTDRKTSPQQSAFLVHALVIWTIVTTFCIGAGFAIARRIIVGLRLIISSSLPRFGHTYDEEDIDAASAMDSGYYTDYGHLVGTTAVQSPDDSSFSQFWASDNITLTDDAMSHYAQDPGAYGRAQERRTTLINSVRWMERMNSGRPASGEVPLITRAASPHSAVPQHIQPWNGSQSELSDADDEIDEDEEVVPEQLNEDDIRALADGHYAMMGIDHTLDL